MAGRFDPVRDSVTSLSDHQRDMEMNDVRQSHLNYSPQESHADDQIQRERKPSRSASIADILNDSDDHSHHQYHQQQQRPEINRYHVETSGSGIGSGTNEGNGVNSTFRFTSSPSTSNVMLPPSFSSPLISPTAKVADLPTHGDSRLDAEYHGSQMYFRRQSSSVSATSSSTESHTHPHGNHIHMSISQKTHQSPSVLNMLNSEPPRSIDDGRYSQIPALDTIEKSQRSRGPSFAGGLSILSPTNESAKNGRSGSGSYFQREGVNESPLQRASALPSPQHTELRSRQNSVNVKPGSFFAVPEVPFRSPEGLRHKTSLPSIHPSPDFHHSSIPSHQLAMGEYESLDQRSRSVFQPSPRSTMNVYAGQGNGQSQGNGVNGLPRSPHSMTPRYHADQPQSPMEVPTTPGAHYPLASPGSYLSQPLTPSAMHHRAEGERMADYHLASVSSHPSRPWIERDQSSSRLSQSSSVDSMIEHEHGRGVWSSHIPPTMDRRNLTEESATPSKKRKEVSSSSTLEDENYLDGRQGGASEDRSQADTMPSEPIARKRGRPKGSKSISKVVAPVAGDAAVPVKIEGGEGVGGAVASRESTEATNVNSDPSVRGTLKEEENIQVNAPVAAVHSSLTTSMKSEEGTPVAAATTPSTLPTVPKTAYRPSTRVSVPTTIRLPVTSKQVDEMRFQCRNSLRTKWQESNPMTNDGWNQIVSEFEGQISPPDKQSERGVVSKVTVESAADKKRKSEAADSNAKLVALHYNSRQDQGLGARRQSPILPLRNFNNWVKSVIIGTYAKRHGRVLDLGGGKGGDLNKWEKGQISEYILCDIASVSVEQAESRYNDRRCHFQAKFFSFDCFSVPLAENIPRVVLDPLFDNVTLQFCLHYGWESVSKAQLMLENIARYLKPGGIFVGTIPNADLLRSRLTDVLESSSSSGNTSSDLSFGNQYYKVRFDPSTTSKNGKFPAFGHKYYFTLVDAVDDVAEYVVDWDQFISLAHQNGLECIFKKSFEQIWREEGQLDRFRDLTRKMRITADGNVKGIPMNEELWEATGIYLAFAFEKKTRP
ncbi:hypothetical protein CBS101457_004354 [Exobasidium rhododendri]|nr:hypothetical protein CBS101457_004354 [Exobasidium rhododendri]